MLRGETWGAEKTLFFSFSRKTFPLFVRPLQKLWQLTQATVPLLNDHKVLKTLRTPCTQNRLRWQRGRKQTNKHAVQGLRSLHDANYTFTLQPVKAACLLPLTQSLPRPCCWNKAPTVCARSGELARDDIRPPPPRLRLRLFGGWGVGRPSGGGITDWGVCGNRAPARLHTCEKGRCAAHLQCRSAASQAHF